VLRSAIAVSDAAAAISQAVDAPEDLHECDVILLCLPTSADVESVLARVPLKPGVLVIDCTSGEPATSRRIATTLHERCGARFVDAPVSGGPKGAHTGTLTSMLGGTEADCVRRWLSNPFDHWTSHALLTQRPLRLRRVSSYPIPSHPIPSQPIASHLQ
jgi:3-hydroxyisobutyrate dehydrogenase-like beta-hydroxyacid dehydrogenase